MPASPFVSVPPPVAQGSRARTVAPVINRVLDAEEPPRGVGGSSLVCFGQANHHPVYHIVVLTARSVSPAARSHHWTCSTRPARTDGGSHDHRRTSASRRQRSDGGGRPVRPPLARGRRSAPAPPPTPPAPSLRPASLTPSRRVTTVARPWSPLVSTVVVLPLPDSAQRQRWTHRCDRG